MIHLAKIPVCTSDSKHNDVRHHCLRDLAFRGYAMCHEASDEQQKRSDKATQQIEFILRQEVSDKCLILLIPVEGTVPL